MESERELEPLKHHRLAAFVGAAHVPSGETKEEGNAVWVPTLGLDYEYWFSHKFAVGLYNDVELGEYIINTEEREDLNRHYAFITAAVGVWEPVRRLAFYAGPGIEIEDHENFFVIKVGTEYGFPLPNWWDLAVSLTYDWKDVYGAWSLGVSAGKRFGPTVMK